MTKNFFRASAEDFKKIPGSPVAYWVSKTFRDGFLSRTIGEFATPKQGLITGDNNRFLRLWHEVSLRAIGSGRLDARKWFHFNKGGEFRRWSGNREYVINWEHDGFEIKSLVDEKGKLRSRPQNLEWNFHQSLSWSLITSGSFAVRYYDDSFMFNVAGISCFPDTRDIWFLLALLNTKITGVITKIINPTINMNVGDIAKIPVIGGEDVKALSAEISKKCVLLTCKDWDAYETSWEFTLNPLVVECCNPANPVNPVEKDDAASYRALPEIYAAVREKWAKDCEEMRRLETENNRIFIEAYGLQGELTPEVPWQEITLTCNPFYRYGVKEVEKVSGGGDGAAGVCALPRVAELEERLKGDTVKELISYGVGCMMGRYSLAKPGLILADQGAQVSDRWIVVSGQRSGQGLVDSGQRSGQGGVDRVQCRDLLVLRETVVECVRKELQRIDCLAEGDGSRGRSVSTGEAASSGGAVCLVGSTATSGRIDSVEHRRGTGTEHDTRLSELSDNGSRVVLRDGNNSC